MDLLHHLWLGLAALFDGPAAFTVAGMALPAAPLMVVGGLFVGILVGATPGLAGPTAMAVALPILISIFGYRADALLPVLGFLIGLMKGATLGGAVPAILFNTPGTPDALLTTRDGYPLCRAGKGGRALRIAHFASVSGDSLSDLALFCFAPFLAVLVESLLDLPEKTALILLSLAFVAAVVGPSIAKGLLSLSLGLLVACVGTGESFTPRLTVGSHALADGFPAVSVILGVLILGEIFVALEDLRQNRGKRDSRQAAPPVGDERLSWSARRRLLPFVLNSAAIGTVIGALPGIGSTMAATLGYASGQRLHVRLKRPGPAFGEGAEAGVAATEAANSAVSGANMIPLLSLGIPGNAAAVFLLLAMDSIGGLNPGPSIFRLPASGTNPELVLAFGLFGAMALANLLNWLLGGAAMRAMAVTARVPRPLLLPAVLLVSLTAVYLQEPRLSAVCMTLGFGLLGYLFRRLEISVLPFVIAFVLAGNLESSARQAFAATGGDPFFLVSSPLAALLTLGAIAIVVALSRGTRSGRCRANSTNPSGEGPDGR